MLLIATLVLAASSYPWLKEIFKDDVETVVYLR
jgi:hypothetical protein